MSENPSTRMVRNPWSDSCTVNGDPNGLMGARTLILAMQWGAPSISLTPEARQLLNDYFAWADREAKNGINVSETHIKSA